MDRIDSLERISTEWNELAAKRGGIFATWEWATTWWEHFGRERELLVHACRNADGRLLAVLPMYAWRDHRPRIIRFVGHGPSDELGPIYVGGTENRVAANLRVALDSLEWDVFFGEQLAGNERWSELLEGRSWRRESSPVLFVPSAGWPDYLGAQSSNFRQQLQQRMRRLEAAGNVEFRLACQGTLERDLDTLFALHRARWGRRRTDFTNEAFHREFAQTALGRGWLRLWLLELDGVPVAAWHGFHVGEVTSYYQAGRDPAAERLSVGFVLLAHTLRAAMDEGASEYRFGRGGEAFKSRFTRHDPGLETVALTRGVLGSSALAAAGAMRALRNAYRNVLPEIRRR